MVLLVTFLFLSLVLVFISSPFLGFFLLTMYVPRKSVKDVTTVARGGHITPSTLVPLSLGGVAPSAIVVVLLADVMSTTPALISLVALEVLGSSIPDVVLLELSSLVAIPREASAAEVVVLGRAQLAHATLPRCKWHLRVAAPPPAE